MERKNTIFEKCIYIFLADSIEKLFQIEMEDARNRYFSNQTSEKFLTEK